MISPENLEYVKDAANDPDINRLLNMVKNYGSTPSPKERQEFLQTLDFLSDESKILAFQALAAIISPATDEQG